MDQRPDHKLNILKLIDEKVGNSLEYIGPGKIFQKGTLLAHGPKATINKWGGIKLKLWQTTERKMIFFTLQLDA